MSVVSSSGQIRMILLVFTDFLDSGRGESNWGLPSCGKGFGGFLNDENWELCQTLLHFNEGFCARYLIIGRSGVFILHSEQYPLVCLCKIICL
jgi:hypothetical protein